jgi:hypothetical protein
MWRNLSFFVQKINENLSWYMQYGILPKFVQNQFRSKAIHVDKRWSLLSQSSAPRCSRKRGTVSGGADKAI